MRIKHLLYVAALTLITVLACQKEVSQFNITGPTDPVTVSATVVGRITNETGAPLQGALVKAGTSSAQTNINGEFRINNARLAEKAAFITVEKSGYFTGSRTFMAKLGQKHYVEIQLLPKSNAGSVNASTGGTITLTDGSSITLPASGVVVKSSGAAYTGMVQIAMTWIDPTSASLMRQMPGDLRGINAAATEMGLQSFGMLGVELSGTGGEALQIATGKNASLKFPLPATISASAPATIPLWSFNDTTGLWKQEGTAIKSGNFYTAEVGHFSFWNCDAQFPVVNFSAKLVNQSGQPLQHVMVRIKRVSTGSYSTGWTDSSGNVSGMVPSNEALVLDVFATSACNTAIFSQNIGPFTTNTNLGTIAITLAAASTFTVTGTVVNCSNTAVTAGYIEVHTGVTSYRTALVNGAFTLSFPGCSASQSITYYAADSSNSVQSSPVTTTITSGSSNLGTISACGLSTQQFINFTLNGTSYTITAPPDSTTGRLSQTQTLFSGYKGSGATTYTSLSSAFTGSSTGTFPLSYVFVSTPSFHDSTSMPAGGIPINITEYGAVGSYIAGNFTGTLNGTGSATHTLQCTFRVKRNN